MKDRTLLIVSLSIIIGIVISCVALPLGGFAILLASVDSRSPDTLMPATTWQEQRISGSGTDRMVVLTISGIIGSSDDTSLLGTVVGHEGLLSQIEQAADDPLVKAVVLRIDSPGGGVVASNEIYQQLQKITAAEKPLVVSMGTVAASGGYYVALPADYIYANPDTITGSMGVIISALNYDDAFDKLGLEQIVYKSGKHKDILSPARAATAEEEQIVQAFVDEAYQGFVDVIVEGRGLERETVLKLADGRIYSGRQAAELQLIDGLGNQEDAIEKAKELAGLEDVLVVRYRSGNSLADLLSASVEAQQQPADPLGVRAVLEQQGPRIEYRLVP